MAAAAEAPGQSASSSTAPAKANDAGWSRQALYSFAALVVLLAVVVWGYWAALDEAVERWLVDPQYTHGFLVPLFAIFLLWHRRHRFPGVPGRMSMWGLVIVLGAAILRLAGTYFSYGWVASVSLIPVVAGICVMLYGWPGLRWAWPAIAFLFFMFPLPYRVQGVLALTLQRLGTQASTYILQTIGYTTMASGTTILMGDVKIRVVQACSGLSMLLTFFALSTGMVLVIRRPLRDKIILVLSAAPVALIANVFRITLTGICYKHFGIKIGEAVFHDFAGWLMMPLALAILGLELFLLSRLVIEVSPAERLASKPLTASGRSRVPTVPVKGSKAASRPGRRR